MKQIAILITTFLLLGLTGNVSAVMLGFGCISENAMSECAIGEAQISLDVTDAMNDQVLFKFTNNGPANSFISDIYFDNDNGTNIGSTLASIAELQEGLGVDFVTPINGMGDLPGGNQPGVDFNTTMELEAQNASGMGANTSGVDNNNEMLGILLNLQMGKSFADVLNELANGDLRVGIHVQGFDNMDPGSASFINTPVPLPAAVWMMVAGLIGLISFGRSKHI